MKNRRAFIIGIKSTSLSKKEKLFLKKYKPWGVILFARNLKKFEQIDNIKIIRSKISFNVSRGFYSLALINEFIKESKKADYINLHFPLTEIFPLIFLSRKPIFLNYHCLPNSNTFFSKIL